MKRVEVSSIIDAERADLFYFTDWCYNAPEWFPSIRKAWIIKLPDSTGLGKIARYVGIWMGREIEWEAESGEWKENEIRVMRAVKGFPASMNMRLEWRYERAPHNKTEVTVIFHYKLPYGPIGSFIDRLFIRREAQRQMKDAIEGMKKAVYERRIPPIDVQFEKRKTDHPGYAIVSSFRR